MLKKYYQYHEKKREFGKKYPMAFNIISLASIIFWVFVFKTTVLDANNIPTGSMVPTLKIGDFLFVNKMRYTLHLPFTDIQLLRFDDPKRGDIVTFTPPDDPNLKGKTLVKRIIGVGGDSVHVVDDEIYVNNMHYPVTLSSDRTLLNNIDYPGANDCARKDDIDLYEENILDPKDQSIVRKHYILKQNIQKLKKRPEDCYFTLAMMDTMRNPDRDYVIPEGKYMVMGDNRDDSDDSRRWGFVDKKDIHGKVFMTYFSVDWGSRYNPDAKPVNPIKSILKLLAGNMENVHVRWERAGRRVY